jgi:hypothetical protein
MAEGGSWRSGTSDDLAGSPGALGFVLSVPGSGSGSDPIFCIKLCTATD